MKLIKELKKLLQLLVQKNYFKESQKHYPEDKDNVVISVDEDFDGTPDTNIVSGKETEFDAETNWTAEQKELAKELGSLFIELAPQTGATTLTSQMSALVELYNKAIPAYETTQPSSYDTIYTYNYFGKYKAAG